MNLIAANAVTRCTAIGNVYISNKTTCDSSRQHKLKMHPELRHINDVVTRQDYWFLIMVAGLPIKSRIVLMSPLLQSRRCISVFKVGEALCFSKESCS